MEVSPQFCPSAPLPESGNGDTRFHHPCQVLPGLWLKYFAVKLLATKNCVFVLPEVFVRDPALTQTEALVSLWDRYLFQYCRRTSQSSFEKKAFTAAPSTHLHSVILILSHPQHAAHNWRCVYTVMAWVLFFSFCYNEVFINAFSLFFFFFKISILFGLPAYYQEGRTSCNICVAVLYLALSPSVV